MQDQLSRMEHKLDIIAVDIAEIKVQDGIQNAQLTDHIRRTEALERRFDALPQRLLVITSILGGLATLLKLLS